MSNVFGNSWLVQRLHQPVRLGAMKDNPFSFGGGIKNGGLSDEAMDLMRDIWAFDYMGAAEFEFGAVPEALRKIAKADLTAYTFTVPRNDVPRHWKDKTDTDPGGEAEVFVICPSQWASEVRERINEWARDSYPRLKEGLRLTDALRPSEDGKSWDPCGWLELDNGFLFFTDREMWEKATELFDVQVEVSA